MLIDGGKVKEEIKHLSIRGALHIGAHDCEELGFYTNTLGLPKENVIWIDALQSKVDENVARGTPNVFQAVITDKDDEIVKFNVSNNIQSSSILEFGTHAQEYVGVHYVRSIELNTTTLDTFAKVKDLDTPLYNFWNLDIQGAELLAMRGGKEWIKHADAVYIEVNVAELYKGCALLPDIDAFLGEEGFDRVLTDITQYQWGDALYVRKRAPVE